MKHIMEFDTGSDGWDVQEYNMYMQAPAMCKALSEIMEKVRSWYKHDNRDGIPQEEIFETVVDIMREEGVDLDKMGW